MQQHESCGHSRRHMQSYTHTSRASGETHTLPVAVQVDYIRQKTRAARPRRSVQYQGYLYTHRGGRYTPLHTCTISAGGTSSPPPAIRLYYYQGYQRTHIGGRYVPLHTCIVHYQGYRPLVAVAVLGGVHACVYACICLYACMRLRMQMCMTDW